MCYMRMFFNILFSFLLSWLIVKVINRNKEFKKRKMKIKKLKKFKKTIAFYKMLYYNAIISGGKWYKVV